VLTAARAEPVTEVGKIVLVDAFQDPHQSLLDDLVLQSRDAQWAFLSTRFRDPCALDRLRTVATCLDPLVQILQARTETIVSVRVPIHPVDTGGRLPFERHVGVVQQVGGAVMQQTREPACRVPLCCVSYPFLPGPRAIWARCPRRGLSVQISFG
jgi:hypothetical protein